MKEEENILFWTFATLQLVGIGIVVNSLAQSIMTLIGGVLFAFGLIGFEHQIYSQNK